MSVPLVAIRFEREGVDGIVPEGVTLADAGRSLGIRFNSCKPAAKSHFCSIIVKSGIDSIDSLTVTESEHFDKYGRRSNERLGCEARIIKPGEIVVMTKANTQETKKTAEGIKSDLQAEFNALPLEKKFASLLQMEAATINEAVKYVADSSMKALEKLGDVISEFGAKVETEAKKATSSKETEDEPITDKEKPRTGAKRKPAETKE